MENQDISSLERAAGMKVASQIRSNLRSTISSVFKKRTGLLLKSGVRARFKKGCLDRITISSPKYSFMGNYGSIKNGQTPEYTRKSSSVKAFVRRGNGRVQNVSSFTRRGGSVKAHSKNQKYHPYGHLAEAMRKSKPALEELATSLANHRAIQVTSHLKFEENGQ